MGKGDARKHGRGNKVKPPPNHKGGPGAAPKKGLLMEATSTKKQPVELVKPGARALVEQRKANALKLLSEEGLLAAKPGDEAHEKAWRARNAELYKAGNDYAEVFAAVIGMPHAQAADPNSDHAGSGPTSAPRGKDFKRQARIRIIEAELGRLPSRVRSVTKGVVIYGRQLTDREVRPARWGREVEDLRLGLAVICEAMQMPLPKLPKEFEEAA